MTAPGRVDVLVIGAGPAGLTAAAQLADRGAHVRVVDRDEAPGGVPRHSDHPGYGLREARVLTGPAYARRLTDRAVDAGTQIDVRTTVTDVIPLPGGGARVELTSPAGREAVEARAVLLATGCRERPRAARLVPGARPAGVMTTGWLQRLVHLDHGTPGDLAIVVGAEHVSYSAVVTLAEAGGRTVAMVTEGAAHTSFAAFDLAARMRYRFPLLTSTRIEAIHGSERVTAVTLAHADGRRVRVDCDTVVFTGDWYPENELAIRAGLSIDERSHGPSVDTGSRTTVAGIFATGNVLHPASTADACAHGGASAAPSVIRWLETQDWPDSVPLEVQQPLLWSAPSRVVPGETGHVRLQTAEARTRPRVQVSQGSRLLWSGRIAWLVPTRPVALPRRALAGVAPGAPVVVALA